MPHIRTQYSKGPASQEQQYQQPQYNQQNMATSQQSQRSAQHYAHQPMQQAARHRENRDRGVDPSMTTSESDTDQPRTYMSDVRKMAPADKAMESLTTYHVTKLVKKRLTMMERSLTGVKPWEKTDIVRRDSLRRDEILESLHEASRKNTRDLWARIAKYPEALRAQVDRATRDRQDSEKDCRFAWELLQTDDELVPLPPNTEASDHEKPSDKHNESRRKHEAKRKEAASSAVWSDSSSATGKRRSDRVAVTLYFKRSPGPGQNPVALYRQLRKRVNEAPPRQDTRPKTVPVPPQNEAPAYEPIPVAAEYTPPVHHGPRQHRNQILGQTLDSNRCLSLSRLTQSRERNTRKLISMLHYTVAWKHKLRSMPRILRLLRFTLSRECNPRRLINLLHYTVTWKHKLRSMPGLLRLLRLTLSRECNPRKPISMLHYTVAWKHKLRSMPRILRLLRFTQSRECNIRKLINLLHYTVTWKHKLRSIPGILRLLRLTQGRRRTLRRLLRLLSMIQFTESREELLLSLVSVLIIAESRSPKSSLRSLLSLLLCTPILGPGPKSSLRQLRPT
ncbi:hypothetical protein NHJ13734_001295 [Beauveria thailandica]